MTDIMAITPYQEEPDSADINADDNADDFNDITPDKNNEYIGNKSTKKFHYTYCRSLPAEKNRIIFHNRDEAIKKGYVACKICNP